MFRNAVVCIGEVGTIVGSLGYAKSGTRENTTFAYSTRWLESTDRFKLSPDLPMVSGNQFHKAATKNDSSFHLALADTAPDGWGCRVIARDHAKRRKAALAKGSDVTFAALTEWDYLTGVDDISRIGALRLQDDQGHFLRTIDAGERATPPLLDLGHLLGASHAVERGTETAADLRYLRGRGTSLGGLRPKCSIVDEDGHLAIGKFPSVKDARSVTRGEVLALHLAQAAGIDAAQARIVCTGDDPVAVIRRFDRTGNGDRIPYLSAASMLQARRDDDRAYTEIADCLIASSPDPQHDLAELWRRIVFNLLITNVDDHLHNHGFLHTGHGQWRLAPAFDINPFPEKEQELKTWLSEESGPVSSIQEVMQIAGYFWLKPEQSRAILAQVVKAISGWRDMAMSKPIGMLTRDLADFAPAFEHVQMERARELL